jgi:uncharacterized protein
MSIIFWDTSALVKRYIAETGTPWVRGTIALSAGHKAVIAKITAVEVASAIARRIRDGSVTQRSAQAAQLLFERHIRREYTVIAVTDSVIMSATALSYRLPLRAYDAVQLASALEANQRMILAGFQPLLFLSSDRNLIKAAHLEGLLTDNPETYP